MSFGFHHHALLLCNLTHLLPRIGVWKPVQRMDAEQVARDAAVVERKAKLEKAFRQGGGEALSASLAEKALADEQRAAAEQEAYAAKQLAREQETQRQRDIRNRQQVSGLKAQVCDCAHALYFLGKKSGFAIRLSHVGVFGSETVIKTRATLVFASADDVFPRELILHDASTDIGLCCMHVQMEEKRHRVEVERQEAAAFGAKAIADVEAMKQQVKANKAAARAQKAADLERLKTLFIRDQKRRSEKRACLGTHAENLHQYCLPCTMM